MVTLVVAKPFIYLQRAHIENDFLSWFRATASIRWDKQRRRPTIVWFVNRCTDSTEWGKIDGGSTQEACSDGTTNNIVMNHEKKLRWIYLSHNNEYVAALLMRETCTATSLFFFWVHHLYKGLKTIQICNQKSNKGLLIILFLFLVFFSNFSLSQFCLSVFTWNKRLLIRCYRIYKLLSEKGSLSFFIVVDFNNLILDQQTYKYLQNVLRQHMAYIYFFTTKNSKAFLASKMTYIIVHKIYRQRYESIDEYAAGLQKSKRKWIIQHFNEFRSTYNNFIY